MFMNSGMHHSYTQKSMFPSAEFNTLSSSSRCPRFLNSAVSSVDLLTSQMRHIDAVLSKLTSSTVQSLCMHVNGRCKGRSFYILMALKSAQAEGFVSGEDTEAIIVQVVMESV